MIRKAPKKENQYNKNSNNIYISQSPSSTLFLIKYKFGNVCFWGEWKTGMGGEKEISNNERNPYMASTPGFEPGHN